MRYKVEKDFEYKGYRCVVIFGRQCHRCGYVGIPKTHPLHGKKYNDTMPDLTIKDIDNVEVDKRGVKWVQQNYLS